MKSRTVILVVLALVCGVSTAVGVNQLATQSRAARIEQVSVVTAAADVPRGSLLSATSVTLSSWPKSMVPAGAIATAEEVAGRAVVVPLVKGEPVLEAKLASKEAGRGLASMIPFGMRAFTIHTQRVESGVGGFVMPGDKVDVILTTSVYSPQDGSGGGMTTTLLQNIQVLAVAQRLDAPDSNKVDLKELNSVTLLVTPDQVAKLDLGMNKGILHLSLRNPEDKKDAHALPATMADLRFDQEKPRKNSAPVGDARVSNVPDATAIAEPVKEVLAAAKRRAFQIHTLRGTEWGVILFERP